MPSTVGESTLKALEGKRLERCVGRPSYESVDETRREIAREYAKAKTTHTDFPLGKKLGFAAAILKHDDYITLHNKLEADPDEHLDDDWQFDNPTRLARYDATITGNMLEATRKNREDTRKGMLEQWDIFDAYETKYKDLVEEAYDATYIKALKDDFLGFSHCSVRDMLDELDSHCLSLTTNEKQSKLKAAVPAWDQDEDTDVFFNALEDCEDKLRKLKIEWPISHKIGHAVTEMTNSGVFNEDDIMDWEDKPEDDKTWVHCQAYWNRIYKKRKRFNNLKPKQHGFEGAANVTEHQQTNMSREELSEHLSEISEAATADKEHIQQMSGAADDLLIIIKKQQAQLEKLIATNEKLIETNSVLTASIAKLSTKKTNNGNNRNNRNTKKADVEKIGKDENAAAKGLGCAICGKHSNTKDCFELQANKNKRPDGWTSYYE